MSCHIGFGTMSDLPENVNQNLTSSNIPPLQNKRRKRKNKNKKQKQLNAKKKVFKRKPNSATKAVLTMSAWAEQFTFAATWQIKHQLAYWKAKAKSLQYENGVLHDIIRKNHYVSNIRNSVPNTSKMSDYSGDERIEAERNITSIDEDSTIEEGTMGEWKITDGVHVEAKMLDKKIDNSKDISDERHNIEVSEEFIQFLMVNAKHKEDLRLERERLKALEEKEALELRESKLKARRHYGLSMKELYGDKWQRINALEMCIKSRFMSSADSSVPAFWPVIPFNFEAVNN